MCVRGGPQVGCDLEGDRVTSLRGTLQLSDSRLNAWDVSWTAERERKAEMRKRRGEPETMRTWPRGRYECQALGRNGKKRQGRASGKHGRGAEGGGGGGGDHIASLKGPTPQLMVAARITQRAHLQVGSLDIGGQERDPLLRCAFCFAVLNHAGHATSAHSPLGEAPLNNVAMKLRLVHLLKHHCALRSGRHIYCVLLPCALVDNNAELHVLPNCNGLCIQTLASTGQTPSAPAMVSSSVCAFQWFALPG